MTQQIALAIHGGAGTILREKLTDEMQEAYRAGLMDAVMKGWDILRNNGTALDAITAAVVTLEDDILFNAGRGSVYTHEGKQEMDASIMNGRTLEAGCVAAVRNVRNPILLARSIMEQSPHVFLSGTGASEFAAQVGIEFADDDYFHDENRYQQLLDAREQQRIQLDHSHTTGTVGAVALDSAGDLAAATSTGGMTNKQFGRIGDSPVPGAGTYANNASCAVSCTGHGEYFLRALTAYDLAALMDYKSLSLSEASQQVLEKLAALGGRGGFIAVDRSGQVVLPFNTEGMYRAWIDGNGKAHVRIFRDDE